MKSSERLLAVLILGGVGLGLTGCGERAVAVHGRIHNNGKPVAVKEVGGQKVGQLNIYLLRQDKDAAPEQAIVDSTAGTFMVPGPKGNGIPPGTYKITVVWKDSFEPGPDKLKDVFSEQNSGIIREVNGHDEIVINVGNPPTGEEKK
jgi:hypothetical protein